MTTLALKSYQQAALDALKSFARSAQLKGPALAFGEQVGRPYNPDPFGEVPCICLRIPTGGGKTLMAAHAVSVLAQEWRATDAPVAVWLVPSDTIRSQTHKALQTPGHPYREALEASYGTGVRVCVLEDLANITPSDWGQRAVVVVATIQSFRIDDTDKRNVYSFSESFERHFKGCDEQRLRVLRDLPDAVVTAEEAANDKTGVLGGFVGQPRWSLSNWLALHEPLLIVDEAHNTKTDKSFTALKRLNPSAILELTATPIPAKTNVLYHVSAQELASEAMIKLPIALAEHPQGWQQAVFAAVQNQRALEGEALKDEATGHGYVRPIVLFQAQNENDEVPPAALRKHLEDELHIPKAQIKVATFEIYLKDSHVRLRAADASQIAFDYGSSTITADDLVRWLDQSLFQKLPEFTLGQRTTYFAAVVSHLIHERGIPLVTLAKARFKLAQDIEARVGDLKDKAAKTQFRQLVLEEAWNIEPDWSRPLVFEANRYPVPAGSRYSGRYQFNKHFYPVQADLKDDGEEFLCAQLLDNHAKVKHWVRNLTTAPCGFALATSRGRFFPDFIAELVDGRLAVVEYKGAHLLNDPYEIEKRQIGDLWARKSQGRCLFGQIAKERDGVGMSVQLDTLLK